MRKNKISSLFTLALFAISGIYPNTSPALALENPLENCTQQPILITNNSSKWIGILGVRWLNEAAGKWILQPINNEIIRQKGTWATHVTPWGLEGHQTYYQVKFKFLENEDQMDWSETKTTSQVQVEDCRAGEEITIRIVDFR